MGAYILFLSLSLQLLAASLAARQLRLSGRPLAWLCISVALVLMTIRRGTTLFLVITDEVTRTSDLVPEMLALVISVLMVVGVVFMARHFEEIRHSNQRLDQETTERKRADEALHRLNRELRAIGNCNQALVRAENEQTLLTDICRIICDEAGYCMAWVGFAENDDAKTIRPVAWAGAEDGYLGQAGLTWADTERGQGPAGTVIRNGELVYVQDFTTEPQMAPWRESALQRDYRSGLALPLKDESAKVFGVLLIYHSESNAVTPTEIQLMEELAGDLAFGIVTLRTRAERKRAEEDLRKMNERFSLATRSARLGVWDWDIQKNELVWDDGMYALYGIKREDFAGAYEAWLKAVHPDDRARSDEMSQLAQRGEREYDTESRVVWPDGSIHYLKAYGQIVRDTGGRPLRMTGINFDVTGLKRAEQERLDHLRFFESLDMVNRAIQGAPDVDGMMSDVLDAVLSIFDCDRAWLFNPCDPDAPSFRVPMEITKPEYPGAKLLNVDLPMSPDMAQNLREALESVGPVTYTAGTQKPINKVSADRFGVKSMMMLALYPKSGEPWAFGLHQCSYPRVWTSEEQRLFQEVGRRLEDTLSALLAHRNLQDSEERFRTVFEQGPLGMSILRANLERVAINAKLTEMFGYTKEELRKLTFLDLTHPDDLELTREHVGKLLKKEIPSYQIEKRYIKKGGEIVWVRVMLSAVRDSQGELLYLVSMIEEITGHKRVEEALRRANKDWEQTFDAIPDMVMVLDTRHKIIRANRAMTAVLGRSEQEVKGRFCFELFHDENAPPAFCPHSILLKDGKEHSTEVFEPKLGRSLDVRVSPLSDEAGTVIGSVHVMRDVTEQKSLQRQLLQAQKMESIGTLAGGIAHDFNNLLQIVLGYSDMLLFNKKPTDPDYERLRAIREAGKGGAELAKGILAFSRRLEPNARPIDLNNEIIRVQKMLERTIPKMITVQIILADNLMTVNADPGQMEQILLNLAVNAQHAMPDGGRLTIETANVTVDEDYSRTHLDMEPGEYVLLTVSDTGHGMDKEVLERIFEPFFTTKGLGEGTGLGLAMAYGIVKSHKGHITCYSEPGTGTTFRIYLPAIVQEIEQGAAVTQQMLAFGTETILLVDDEKSIRKLGEQMLRMAGYNVLTATNGIEALEVYRSNQDRIALVLLDLMMPEMGGKRCLEELLTINPGVRVVIASGYSANGPTKDVLASGAKGFVNKPFDLKGLLGVVRRTLDESGSSASPVHGSGGSPAQTDEDDVTSSPEKAPQIEGPPAHDAIAACEFPWSLRILAIDDREPYLRMLEAGFSQFGQTAITASSGIEGLQVFLETPVDFVICDLGMPELNGWEVGKRIKEICREKGIQKTPFILLTGQSDREYIDQEERDRMSDCGVDAIVGKPVDIPELLKVAGRLINESADGAE